MEFRTIEVENAPPNYIDFPHENFPVRFDPALQHEYHLCEAHSAMTEEWNVVGILQAAWKGFPQGSLVIGQRDEKKVRNIFKISVEPFTDNPNVVDSHPTGYVCSACTCQCGGRLYYSSVTGWDCARCGKSYGRGSRPKCDV